MASHATILSNQVPLVANRAKTYRLPAPPSRKVSSRVLECLAVLTAQAVLICAVARVAGPLMQLPVLLAVTVVCAGWRQGLTGTLTSTAGALTLPMLLLPLFRVHPGHHAPPIATDISMMLGYLVLGLVSVSQAERLRQGELLVRALKQHDRILEMARRVQSGLLPDEIPQDPRFDMSLYHDTATTLSGDFYDFRMVGDRLHMCVADVSGKGPPAALVSSMLRGVFEMQREQRGPAETLASINRRIHRFLPDDMFITCFYAQLDLGTGELLYASAGHEPIYLRKYEQQVRELGSTGLPLGLEKELEIVQHQLFIAPEDVLLLYTDGLPNAPIGGGERLGDTAVSDALQSFRGTDVERLTHLLANLTPTLSESSQDDDVVIMTLALRLCPAA